MSLIYIRRIFSFDIRTKFLSRVNAACIVIECLLLSLCKQIGCVGVWRQGTVCGTRRDRVDQKFSAWCLPLACPKVD